MTTQAWADLGSGPDRPFGWYLHVPYCTVRCGYCDFNTYTAEQMRGHRRDDWADLAIAELNQASSYADAHGLADQPGLPVADTIFVGGGTPTLLPTGALGRVLSHLRAGSGIAATAEITVEANPDTLTAAVADDLAQAGVNRISIGMQSADPAVLEVLDRAHDPDNVATAVANARSAGISQVSVDLIYAAPGERLAQWRTSVEAALALEPDHISAYSLILEEGTRLHGRVRRGQLPVPDDDYAADCYQLADSLLSAAGLRWYEVSNWAQPAAACRHNLGYWRNGDWWGIGPGAHSHVRGVRWWNRRHPAAWADALAAGQPAALARELLTKQEQRDERVMLGLRLAEGLSMDKLNAKQLAVAQRLLVDGLIDPQRFTSGILALTLCGRLLADRAVLALVTA